MDKRVWEEECVEKNVRWGTCFFCFVFSQDSRFFHTFLFLFVSVFTDPTSRGRHRRAEERSRSWARRSRRGRRRIRLRKEAEKAPAPSELSNHKHTCRKKRENKTGTVCAHTGERKRIRFSASHTHVSTTPAAIIVVVVSSLLSSEWPFRVVHWMVQHRWPSAVLLLVARPLHVRYGSLFISYRLPPSHVFDLPEWVGEQSVPFARGRRLATVALGSPPPVKRRHSRKNFKKKYRSHRSDRNTSAFLKGYMPCSSRAKQATSTEKL